MSLIILSIVLTVIAMVKHNTRSAQMPIILEPISASAMHNYGVCSSCGRIHHFGDYC
jgi:hypothetical protein